MKSVLLFVAIVAFSFSNYSQTQKDSLNKAVRERYKNVLQSESDNPYFTREESDAEYQNENNTFQTLAQPSENSDLANFFKIYLEKKLLKKIDFSEVKWSYLYKDISRSEYNYTIRLTFEISKTGKASGFRIYTGDKDLDRKVIEIFKKYPLEKLALTEADKHGRISVQLFAKENKNTVIKASKFAVVDELPTVKDCENLQTYWQINNCLYERLYDHILRNISLKTINKQELRGEILFRTRFTIDTKGKIVHVNSIAPNDAIKNEIDRLIASFDQVLTPGTRNNIPKNTYCDAFKTLTVENLN
ncbi:hypothetical protein [Flavobacterium daemonense]|uniref:hypothetical protein n=1 Tax=Flavobacterium daemonense TaxID=1393049 RepID=UPI001185EAA4|nr:hypothetical protein [Flavobacterium daemonense]KAF2330687.1 hypothetical protein FND99_14775 [Flavobacterium daemonense]